MRWPIEIERRWSGNCGVVRVMRKNNCLIFSAGLHDVLFFKDQRVAKIDRHIDGTATTTLVTDGLREMSVDGGSTNICDVH
jgi:hypothetical protein